MIHPKDKEAALRYADGEKGIDHMNVQLAAFVAGMNYGRQHPHRHVYFRAGEPDCPPELKAGGELHTLRCRVCGMDDPPKDHCRGYDSTAEELRADVEAQLAEDKREESNERMRGLSNDQDQTRSGEKE